MSCTAIWICKLFLGEIELFHSLFVWFNPIVSVVFFGLAFVRTSYLVL